MTHSKRMANMTRKEIVHVGTLAAQAGLNHEQALEALELGATALSRGIDAYDITRLAVQRIEWLARAGARKGESA